MIIKSKPIIDKFSTIQIDKFSVIWATGSNNKTKSTYSKSTLAEFEYLNLISLVILFFVNNFASARMSPADA